MSTQKTFKEKLFTLLEPRAEVIGLKLNEIDENDNLVELGIFDSVSFLEFISSLESECEVNIDFSELDPSEFSSIAGLIKNIS
jgi:D-alanine--poly(phosphoribitol) ligase subunit 2